MPPPTRALVRRPSLRLAEGELTHLVRTAVDVPVALLQHAAYLALLARHGLASIELPELPDYPDGLFVEDIVVSIDGQLVLTRPGAASRRGEVDSADVTLRALGLASARIAAPATLDGGDVLVLDRHVLVGRSTRSNEAAHEQLRALLHGTRRSVVRVDVERALHLKTGVTRLPDGSLIAYADFVDIALLEGLGYRVLRASEPSGSDVLCLGDSVVLPSDAPRTAADLKQHSYKVECIDISELQKLEAGVTCMSVLL
jgi:dimethylargininase